MRFCVASKRLAPLLKEVPLWAELNFEGVNEAHFQGEVVFDCCRRARGQLRVLDISSEACRRVQMPCKRSALCALAAEGLTANLESVILNGESYDGEFGDEGPMSEDEAKAFLAASPKLRSLAGAKVVDSWQVVTQILDVLPFAAAGTVVHTWHCENEGGSFADFATALTRALSARPVDALLLSSRDLDDDSPDLEDLHADASDEDEADEASKALAAVLADPVRGPVRYEGAERDGWLPALGHLCEALTPASRLRVLSPLCGLMAPEAAALADALSSGRARLESLSFGGVYVPDDDDDEEKEECAENVSLAGRRRLLS